MKKILFMIMLVPFLMLTLSLRAEAVTYHPDVAVYFQRYIGIPSDYYVSVVYGRLDNNGSGFIAYGLKFNGPFTFDPANKRFSGTCVSRCTIRARTWDTGWETSTQNTTITSFSDLQYTDYIDATDYEVIGYAGGQLVGDYTDNFDFSKSDNEMKMTLWLDCEFEEARTYDWWCSTDLYKVTFDVNFNGNTYNIPINFYPQFLVDVGTPTAQYSKVPDWMTDYFAGSDPDITQLGKVMQDYPVKAIKTYSTDYYRNTAFLYNRSDGTKMWLTAWNVGLVGEAETPLYFFPDEQNWYHYYYGNDFGMFPPLATSQKWSNGSGISEFLEFYLSDIKEEMIARVPTFTTNDLYKCTYTVKCYGANKPNVIAYSKTLDWSEYVDKGIAPPIIPDSSKKRNYFKTPDTQDLSDNGTDSVRAPSPFAVNTQNVIDGVKISDFNFQEFSPDSADLSMIGGFFSIFTDSPFGIVLLLALTFLVIKTLIW